MLLRKSVVKAAVFLAVLGLTAFFTGLAALVFPVFSYLFPREPAEKAVVGGIVLFFIAAAIVNAFWDEVGTTTDLLAWPGVVWILLWLSLGEQEGTRRTK